MRSTRGQARFAGFLYLLMLMVGLPGLVLIPGRLTVPGDPAATIERIRASESLFRWGIASELAYPIVFLFLGLALHRLFEPVNRGRARALLALVLASVPIVYVGVIHELGALALIDGALPGAAALLTLHDLGVGVVWVFWALWLVPFGLLVLESRYAPRVLGVLLLVAAAGDLLRAGVTVFPAWESIEPFARVLSKGELPMILWLAIRGANER